MERYKSRRRSIVVALGAVWAGIAALEWLIEPPGWLEALLWVLIFLLAAGVSLVTLLEAVAVLRRLRGRRVPPERLLIHKVNEVRVRGYVRSEGFRLGVSLCALGVGVASVFQWGQLAIPLFYGVALGILGNSLLEREDRREQSFLVEEGD